MFKITRIKTTIKPEKVESLGNGIWYYNYDIKESIEPGQEGQDETVYDFVQVRISGTPDYDKCAKAIIRAYVNSDSEFDLMNSFNAYQLGIIDSAGQGIGSSNVPAWSSTISVNKEAVEMLGYQSY